jgi:hypothetical protein
VPLRFANTKSRLARDGPDGMDDCPVAIESAPPPPPWLRILNV